LAGICLFDLLTTLWLLKYHQAAEANPLMAIFVSQGITAFIVAKLVLTVIPLGALEWARKRRPMFVHRALNLVIAAYLLIYVVGVVRVNSVPHPGSLSPHNPAAERIFSRMQAAQNLRTSPTPPEYYPLEQTSETPAPTL
jgi:hypothetical protein